MLLGSLLVLLVLVCIALSVVILLQRSEGGALGMGGGPSGFMTARGAGDLLTRTTSILAGVFFLLCLLLTVVQARVHGGSVVDRLKVQGLAPNALGQIHPHSAPAPAPAGAPPAAGSAANIGVVTPPPGASFEAPRPEVHTAPAATPAPRSNGAQANRPSASILGVQTAPQSSPTVAPLAPKPAPARPPSELNLSPSTGSTGGNIQGGV